MNRWSTIIYRMQPIMIVFIPMMFFLLPRGFTATVVMAVMYFGLLLPTVVSLGVVLWTSAVRAQKLGISQTGPYTTWALTGFYAFAALFGCALGGGDGGTERSLLVRLGLGYSASSGTALVCFVAAGACLALAFGAAIAELWRVDDIALPLNAAELAKLGRIHTSGRPHNGTAGPASVRRAPSAWSRFLYARGLGLFLLPLLFFLIPALAAGGDLQSLALGALGVSTPMSVALFLVVVPADLRSRKTNSPALGPVTTWLASAYCASVVVAACATGVGRGSSAMERLGLSQAANSLVLTCATWLAASLAVATVLAAWWEYALVRRPKLPMVYLWDHAGSLQAART